MNWEAATRAFIQVKEAFGTDTEPSPEVSVRYVVNAALGDTVLYREATPSEWATGKADSQDMPVVQVWPIKQGGNDE